MCKTSFYEHQIKYGNAKIKGGVKILEKNSYNKGILAALKAIRRAHTALEAEMLVAKLLK